jgi:hypothetical protein
LKRRLPQKITERDKSQTTELVSVKASGLMSDKPPRRNPAGFAF